MFAAPMRRRAVAVVLLLIATMSARGRAASAVGAEQAPTMTAFIAAVRGYDITTIRRTFPAYNTGLFEQLYGAGPGIPLDDPALVDLFMMQNVITPAGTVLDAGHIITALEAATAPTSLAQVVAQRTGCDMTAAVTWSGDVGNAVHTYLAEGMRRPADAVYDDESPPEDLYGDIDGWLLAVQVAGSSVDVAALLEQSYADPAFEAGRFHRFVGALGGVENGRLSDAARGRVVAEVACFARAVATLGNTGVTPDAIDAAAPSFVDRFITFLEDGLAAEGAG